MKNWKHLIAAPLAATVVIAGATVPAYSADAPAELVVINEVGADRALAAYWTELINEANSAEPMSALGTSEGAEGDALSKQCVGALAGWGVAGAVLIPVAILAQMGNPTVLTVCGVIRYVFEQAFAVLELRLGASNPALGAQVAQLGSLAIENGPLLAALSLGTLAVATTATACAAPAAIA